VLAAIIDLPANVGLNALGGIAWAISIGVGVHLLGDVAEKVISTAGPAAAAAGMVALLVFVVWRRRAAA
jgi:MYXO-CTERM domain-containing protein